MKATAIPERLTWAVEVLDVQPADRLLEIGCGRGVAVSLICQRLSGGTITAIDRSDLMIEAARERNPDAVSSGKARFQSVALAEAELEGERFDKIFAVNVNLFWLKASRELARIRGFLAPRGALYLFYQPPTKAKVRPLADKLKSTLEAHGFRIAAVRTANRNAAPLLCVVAARLL
jgi:trans-aconitate methyltransferase